MISDSWILARRTLQHWTRQPGQLTVGLLFPVMVVLLFAYLFGGQMSVPGGGDYTSYLLPGMFAMTMLFGIEATFAAVAADAKRGITDRFRSLPISPSAVVNGRAAADMLNSATSLAVMIASGLAIGWRITGGPGPAVAAIALLLLLRFALLWAGIYLGLAASGPEALAAVQILVWPLGFLSNVFASPSAMPAWLGALAEWNPLSATVSAARELFGNPIGGTTWVGQHSILMAVAWPLLISAVFVPLSIRRYRNLSR